MMKTPALKILLLTSVSTVLASCGGGGSSAPPPAAPPPPPGGGVSQTPTKTVVGAISGFGSVIVNGVTYNTDTATFTVDEQSATQSDLKVGQIVTIKATTDSNGNSTASSVKYEEIVEGPVANLNVAQNQFEVLGQTVKVNSDTSFDSRITPSDISGLSDGLVVEISGTRDANGVITATRVERSDDQSGNNHEVHGVVSNLDTAAMTFFLGNLKVGYGSAVLEDFGSNSIADGDAVEVEGSSFLNDGTFVATRVENENDDLDDRRGEEDDEAEVEGPITTFDSASRFVVAGITIITNGSTQYEDGTANDLGLNVRIEVEGRFNAAGELVASEIEFEDTANLEVTGRVEAIDSTANTLTVSNIVFQVTAETRFEDNDDGGTQNFNFASIQVNDLIEIAGYQDTNGNYIATKIEREDNDQDDDGNDDDDDGEREIKAPIESISGTSVVLLGVTVSTDANTQFEGRNDENLTRDQFFSQISVGQIIEAEGQTTGQNTMLAREMSIEDNDDDD